MADKKTEQVMVRLSSEMLADLKAEGAANERTVAQTVRLAVKQFLDRARAESERT